MGLVACMGSDYVFAVTERGGLWVLRARTAPVLMGGLGPAAGAEIEDLVGGLQALDTLKDLESDPPDK